MNCPNCHQENPNGANFCRSCGRLQVPDCPRCSTAVIPGSNFCHHCGLPLAPQSQGGWWQTGAAQQPAPSPLPAKPQAAPPTAQQAALEAHPAPSIERFLPRELARKLEAARDSGSMAGERRVLTMLFCDVQGSTAAAEKLDPEEWTEIINGAFEHMIKPVYNYEGTVARLMGDGILAFFGAPIAHEDDPQRAVLAGLDIISGLEAYREEIEARYGLAIAARVGINTGLVVVGAVGSDLRMEYTAMGDAINLAARMEQTAVPGTVQIAEPTYRRVNQFFDIEELGPVTVKGKAEPVAAYRVLGRKMVRQNLRGIEGMQAPLIGRDRELGTLREIVDKTRQGLGHIVCLTGEAGLGKSRLISETQNYWQKQMPSGVWHTVSSFSYEKNDAFGLFQRLIRRFNNIAVTDSQAELRDKLEPLLAYFDEERHPRVMQILETIFAVDSGGNQPRLEGESFQQELFAVMLQIWNKSFAGQPAVLTFDNLQWSDPASVQLLTHLLAATDANPLVIICVFRPEEDAPAVALQRTAARQFAHHYTEINLSKLANAEISAILDGLLPNADLPPLLRQEILERAGGNPFFVEEVVRSLISSGVIVPQEKPSGDELRQVWQAVDGALVTDIPDNLQGLLAARLDRLEENTRSTLQLASVIGRSFYERVLMRIAEQGNGASSFTAENLRRLLQLQIIDEAARIPEVEYIFHNPLTQEVAYKSILLKRRREFHAQVAMAMETLYAEQRAQIAPRLAYHYQEAGMLNKAFDCYALAGDQALHLYALQEALVQYDRALALLDDVQPGAAQLIEVFLNRGRVLEHGGRFAEALADYERLNQLGQERENEHIQLKALVARLTVHSMHSGVYDYDLAQKLAAQGLQLARQLGDKAAESKIEWNLMQLARSRGQEGDKELSIRHGERSLKLARELDLRVQMAFTLSNLAAIYRYAQQLDKANASAEEARSLFREQGNLPMVADSYGQTSHFLGISGKFDEAEAMANEAHKVSSQIGNLWNLGVSTATLALVEIDRGHFEAAQKLLVTTLNLPGMSEFGYVYAFVNLRMVELLIEAGALDRGLAFGEKALATAANAPYVAAPAKALLDLVKLRKEPDNAQQLELNLEHAPATDSVLRAFFDIFDLYYRVELAVAQQKANIAIRLAIEAIASCERFDMRVFLPLFQRLLAQARWLGGDRMAALNDLARAEATAREIGSKRSLWPILVWQARWAADEETAESYRIEALGIIDYIIENAGDVLSTPFSNRPEVKEIRERQENQRSKQSA